ncbi:amidohydrolase family protein [Pseudoxanthomonas sacheonensis]|uniref:amidohydrolase family protein n=1 Tax=Pseudoxanthomonas sacheonensis TaxID=443615 RepID=UPI0013D54D7F|nr:amidohydrolase family protein [Pseudoxanthomonas sacheonensis]KAF1711573.1 amidohydrolase [Pseudoxanthomonas sacheonensis]
MMLVDSHLHFWRLSRGDYLWLTPEFSALYRDFSPNDINATLGACGVGSVVVVQAAATEAETHYLLELAREHPFIAGVVGWTDFEAEDAPQRVAALCRAAQGRLKGLRPMVQDIPDERWLSRSALDPAFDTLIANDLSFDALVAPKHLPALAERLDRHPQLRAVLDHAGKPDIAGGGFDDWARQIVRLAGQGNLSCKLSGLLSEAGPSASAADIEPYVAHLFASFGPERIMWGSDWPVLTATAGYTHWFDMAKALVGRLAAGHLEDVFANNAQRFYRLERKPYL